MQSYKVALEGRIGRDRVAKKEIVIRFTDDNVPLDKLEEISGYTAVDYANEHFQGPNPVARATWEAVGIVPSDAPSSTPTFTDRQYLIWEKGVAGRPRLPEGMAADTQIQLRVRPSRKGAYVRASRAQGKTLAEWIFSLCDAAAGYDPNEASDTNGEK